MDIDEAYKQYSQAVYLYLMSLCHDAHLAQDLTEDTFLKAMRTIGSWRGECSFFSWLCAIAKNEYITDKRRHRRRVEKERIETWCVQDTPETALLREEQNLSLMRRIHALDEEAREVFYLRGMGEMKFSQIGSIMGRTENWARVTFYRAKERIRREMEADV
ncbi:MAG: RNA polymerase sigma factor [Clostridia bacterium]|nr:RNA polymerase sigma factor [Clostridia bacterium]